MTDAQQNLWEAALYQEMFGLIKPEHKGVWVVLNFLRRMGHDVESFLKVFFSYVVTLCQVWEFDVLLIICALERSFSQQTV